MKCNIIIKMDQKHLMNPSVEHDDLSPLCSKYIFTRKFQPHCHPPSSEVRAVLVTGLGGSGTHFIANHLRSLGYRLHHEGLDDDGAVVSCSDGVYVHRLVMHVGAVLYIHVHRVGSTRSTTVC